MRLGQLARKLALRPSQIVDYLASKQISTDDGSNARLNDELTAQVVMHFAPSRLNEIMTVGDKNEEVASTGEVTIEEENITTQEVVIADVATTVPLASVTDLKPEVEVIKASKVELSGLKVLGKIELPESKKKPVPVVVSLEGTEAKVESVNISNQSPEKKFRKSESKASTSHKNNQPRQTRNPIAKQREAQERQEAEKKKVKMDRDKEKRTQYYLQQVKTGQPTKAAKNINEPTVSSSANEIKPVPKTWWGKFLRWLNT